MSATGSSARLKVAERRDLGAFYTPQEMTDFVTAWALRSASDTVLDPGCGDAAFLSSAVRRLRQLGAGDRDVSRQVHGIDLNPDAVATAGEVLEAEGVRNPQIQGGNFFFFRTEGAPRLQSTVDALIGNPPYVRYQLFRDENRAEGLRAAAANGVILPALTSSWAPYVVHAASFLRPGGRIALVLPGELLHVGYAAALRDFLLRSFEGLTLVTFEEKVFPGALEEVVILMGTKGAGDGRIRVKNLQSLNDLSPGPESVLSSARTVDVAQGTRWFTTILESSIASSALTIAKRARFQPLSSLGRVDIGVVTGANDFFVLSKSEVEELDLPTGVLLPALSKAVHVQGTRFTEQDWKGIRDADAGAYLMLISEADRKGAVAKYVAEGERRSLHTRYKCRTRTPWFRVPYVRRPNLFLTYMSHISPRLVTNEAGATHTNTVHGVFLSNPLLAKPLAVAFLNSATLLSTEIEGRSYGGGVLKLEPREAMKVLVPRLTPSVVSSLTEVMPRVDSLVRDGKIDEASVVVDRIVLGKTFRVAEVEETRAALSTLRARRMTRGRTS